MNNQTVDERPVLASVRVPGVFIFDTPEELERARREFELLQLPESPGAPKRGHFGSEKAATQKS
ncbi:MAG: hypothetical protein HYV67_04565 [Candidatus Taylorbacteria bacterium]|nr:hypothetical protein [Candidatus Taylorbacteria bacterium]